MPVGDHTLNVQIEVMTLQEETGFDGDGVQLVNGTLSSDTSCCRMPKIGSSGTKDGARKNLAKTSPAKGSMCVAIQQVPTLC